MKLSLRLISALVLSICVVTFIVARNQAIDGKTRLRSDLARRGEVLTESLQETIEPLLQANSTDQVRRIVQRFDDRQHLAGVEVYRRNGTLLAASANLGHQTPPPDVVAKSQTTGQGTGEFIKLDSTPVYVYALPLNYGANNSGVLVTFHDASYIAAQSTQIWRGALWNVLAEILLVALITFLIVRFTIDVPVAKLSQWMKESRAGKVGPPPQSLPSDFLQPLTSEAASLAHSLTEARHAAKEEAKLRDAGDAQWTAERLRASVQRRLGSSSLFVISNREPYQHVRSARGIEVQIPASGLVTALEPILCACDGTWIAHGSADADRETVDANDRLRVPPDQAHYTLRRVWLSPEEENGYYFGFSNEGIWPLCHIAHTRPNFRAADWIHYRNVNEKFARAVLEEIAGAEEPFVLIQDYHFALLPRLIKAARPDARVAIFWHIPWPNSEAFRICPWEAELLDGLLGADLIGFHIQAHCDNFLDTVDHSIECRIEWERFAVNRNGHFTNVRPLPISVALPEVRPQSHTAPDTFATKAAILEGLGPDVLFFGVGVDRIDYTKGIVERFRSIECFLEKNPHYCGRFSFVQFGAPSRTNIKSYHDLLVEVQSEAQRINSRFQKGRWKPIVLHSRHHNHKEIEPFYQTADLCMVTSLHDGMNLVAKEFVAARINESGVLILSQFTGASRELRDALLVNPYDIEQMADAITRAIEMPIQEQRARMQPMRHIVKERNVYRWAADLISELAEIRLDAPQLSEKR